MPRKRTLPKRDINRENEVLSSPINPTGTGEDAPIQELLSPSFAHKSNTEALDIGLALQQLIRGQHSLLENVNTFGGELVKLRERMDKYDQAAKLWEEDRQGFMDRIEERADKLRIDNPEEKARFRAKAVLKVQEQITQAMAKNTTDAMKFKIDIENQPKETIISPGKVATVNNNGVIESTLIADVIRIRNYAWELPPGVPVLVPKMVADEFRLRQKIEAEQQERQKLLSVSNENPGSSYSQVSREWNNISGKYGSATEPMPEGEGI